MAHIMPSATPPISTLSELTLSELTLPGQTTATRPATPLVSAVVPTFNRAGWLAGTLQSIVDQQTNGRFEFDVHVVDNGSSDNTREVVERLAATAPVAVHYHLQRTPGDAAARNLGVAESAGEWLAFCDDDQLAEPTWLAELCATMSAMNASVVGGAVHLDLEPAVLVDLDPLCRQALRETKLYPHVRTYKRGHLPGGGNALVARRVFEQLGGFDESMTGGGSDCDFFTRARAAGLSMWYTPRAIVRHRIPPQRLSTAFLRWDAMSGGAGHAAHFDYRRRGLVALLLLCLARASAAVLIHLPLLAWAWSRGDRIALLGRWSRLWRIEGYIRRTLSIAAPGWFPQRRFLDSLDLRHGRVPTG